MLDRFSQVGGSLLLAIVLAAAVVMVAMINRLRQGHPQLWNEMGKPAALKFWGDYKGRWSLFKFVFTEAHAALSDPGLTMMVWVMRGLIGAFFVVVAWQLMGGAQP